MKLAVVGSKCHEDKDITFRTIEEFQKTNKSEITAIISGRANVVDFAAKEFATILYPEIQYIEHLHIPLKKKKSYEEYRTALLNRNTLIAKDCDEMLSIECGCANASGSWDVIKKAKNLGKEVHVVHVGCMTEFLKFHKKLREEHNEMIKKEEKLRLSNEESK